VDLSEDPADAARLEATEGRARPAWGVRPHRRSRNTDTETLRSRVCSGLSEVGGRRCSAAAELGLGQAIAPSYSPELKPRAIYFRESTSLGPRST
jgi:hypothetical protein